MGRFWRKKWFWAGVLSLVALGALWYLFLYKPAGLRDSPLGSLRGETDPPTVIIELPEQGAWEGRNFAVQVFEEDLESGLWDDSCTYQVCSYSKAGEERCSGIMQRSCNSTIREVTVGQSALCSFEGRYTCMIFAQAKDRAGNKGEAYSSFHIDFTSPQISESILEQRAGGYVVQGRAQDENAIVRCGLYSNGRYVQDMEFVEDCKKDCRVVATFQPEKPESPTLFIRCSDLAGNTADGDTLLLEVNQSPFVEFCRVAPAQGSLGTEFQFSAGATDPNQDPLLYLWEFGDGNIGEGEEVIHSYLVSGTYTPGVTARDTKGLSAECNTAWVVVE